MYHGMLVFQRASFIRGALACALFAVSLTPFAAGATSLFIQFANIKGEATEPNHKDWSDVSSVGWSVTATQSTAGGGRGVPKVDLSDLSWTQRVDKSVPPLFDALTKGTLIRDVKVDFTATLPAGGARVSYFEMDFRDVLLSSLHLGSSGDAMAELSGAFSYGFIKMTYKQYDEAGQLKTTTQAEYDVKKGSGALSSLAGLYALGASGPDFVVPEPATSGLVLVGLALLAAQGRRRG